MRNIFRSAARRADADAAATLRAVTRSQAVIEFSPDGIILSANDNFLGAMGYAAAEIVGKHHCIFVDPGYATSPDYAAFWDHLRGGKFGTGEYKRFGKGQREVWIQASYNPVTDDTGKVVKIVKFAADITTQKLAALDAQQQLAALSRSQAVIEFTLGGEIINANDNFLSAMGYRLDEIRGKHHAMFVDPSYAASPEYRTFWPALAKGEFKSGEFRRLGKGGREVWIQASYNPIFDADGRPFKVVKTAADITARKRAVETLGTGLEKLAGGDLSFRLETPFQGELEPVRHAFNHTVERFAGIVGNLRTTSSLLRTATGEILSGANDLADRTTKQAAAIEQTSAAMEVLTETVSKNAASADAAHGRTQQLAATAEQVGSVMRQSNDAMQRISESSAKISSIIGLIDDIAFQTNLLALNASVEAARAGDAGKGFAVVAVEVRRLAQSAASASADIKALIEESGGEVANGNRLVAEAAAKLDDVLAGMRESAGLVEGIAQATREQTGSISEVRTAIRQMDEMTQHNAALVEETNAAIEQTEGQASELDKIVDSFVLSSAPPQALPRQRFAANGNAAIAADWDDL